MKYALSIPVLLTLSQPALALDYRSVELTDGRSFVAEVTRELDEGLELTVPAGLIRVKHVEIASIAPSDAETYMLQGDWPVYVANGPERKKLQMAYTKMPGVVVLDGNPDAPRLMNPDQLKASEACGTDLFCLTEVLVDAPWMWLVVAEKRDSKTIGLKGRLSSEHIAFIGSYRKKSASEMTLAIAKAIGVEPSE